MHKVGRILRIVKRFGKLILVDGRDNVVGLVTEEGPETLRHLEKAGSLICKVIESSLVHGGCEGKVEWVSTMN